MKKLFVLSGFVILLFFGCENGQDIYATPPHYGRTPQAINLRAQKDQDTISTRIALRWEVVLNANFKGCDVYRKINEDGRFQQVANQLTTFKLDDTLTSKTDSLVSYFVATRGKDSFVGKNSDTIIVNIKKK